LEELLAYDDEEFVHRAYQALLGREADPAGLGNYVERLRDGVSKLQIATELRMSEEGARWAANSPNSSKDFSTLANAGKATAPSITGLSQLIALHDHDFVRAAYQNVLGREPDPDGFDFYLELVRTGHTKIGILARLLRCDEAGHRRKHQNEWSGAIASRGTSPRTYARFADLSSQSEAPGNTLVTPPLGNLLESPSGEFVEIVFQNLLGRAPDAPALDYYVKRIDSGVSRITVLAEVSKSEEARKARQSLEDLSRAARIYELGQVRWVGWIIRWVTGTEGESETERRLRRVENQIFLLGGNGQPNFDRKPTGVSASQVPAKVQAIDDTVADNENSGAIYVGYTKPFRDVATKLRTLPQTKDTKSEKKDA
jgi:hypothetical protein